MDLWMDVYAVEIPWHGAEKNRGAASSRPKENRQINATRVAILRARVWLEESLFASAGSCALLFLVQRHSRAVSQRTLFGHE
jgi:hypothetical protein